MELINHWQEFLLKNNINMQDLLLSVAASGILLFFAFRELLSWYLKTTQVKIELKRTRKELRYIQHEMKELRDLVEKNHISLVQYIASHSETNDQKKEASSNQEDAPMFPLN